MNVTEKYLNPKDPNHSIEWGKATWNNIDLSIRNRYDLPSGKFNKAGSGEIPLSDFKTMITESIKRDVFTNSELAEILKTISEQIAKI